MTRLVVLRMIRESIRNMVIFEQRLERSEETRHGGLWGRRFYTHETSTKNQKQEQQEIFSLSNLNDEFSIY